MNHVPSALKKIFCIAVCGTGMGSLAGLLKSLGYEVAGSDQNIYPPMSEELARQNITVCSPYAAENIERFAPDLVIIGNAVSASHPEVQFVLANNLAYVSMPQALNHFILQKKQVIVVSGTHGKTTTTSLMAYLLHALNLDPSYLIGGVCQSLPRSFHVGPGPFFVIEGDEYDTAFFDKGPKFLHYNPRHVIMTSLEFDHADIYRDLDHVSESFVRLAKIIPEKGSLHLGPGYPKLQEVAKASVASIHFYGNETSEVAVTNFTDHETGSTFDLKMTGKTLSIASPLSGAYNAHNVAACFSVLQTLGLDLHLAATALKNFRGIKRRQDVVLKTEELTIIDDFAHHPTAVRETIKALRSRFPEKHLVAVFEPRSNSSMRDVFQKDFTNAFVLADEILLARVFNPEKIKNGKILDVPLLIRDLKNSGKAAFTYNSSEEILRHILHLSPKPAVAVIMSNGSFENLPRRLANAFTAKQRPSEPAA